MEFWRFPNLGQFNSSVTNAEVEIEGYKVIRLDHPKHRAGGVCVYVRRSLKSKVLKDLSRISDSGYSSIMGTSLTQEIEIILVVCYLYNT